MSISVSRRSDVVPLEDLSKDGVPYDPNFDYPADKIAFEGGWNQFDADSRLDEPEEDSPYPEVRAAVSNLDDPSIPVHTARVWILGIMWSILLPGVNQFLFFRYPSVAVPSIVAQLLSYPLGRGLERCLPSHPFFNPGPFNMKEHTLITIMANVGAASAYATDIIAVQKYFYSQSWASNVGYQVCLVISTQVLGFCICGFLRPFLVWPGSMIWPSTLVNMALFNTLHDSKTSGDSAGGWSRQKMFGIASLGSFVWAWFTTYIFQALAYFDFLAWISPKNKLLQVITGVQSGMGVGSFTLDWGMISYIGVPQATPWWTGANLAVGFVFFVWIISPIIFFTDTWSSGHLPFSASISYDRFGVRYNVTSILTDGVFDLAKYKEYSEIYLPTTFAMSYGLSFAALTSLLVHTFLFYRKTIITQAKRSLKDEEDVHARLMSVYPEVSQLWYLTLFAANFALGCAAISAWPTELPIWAYVFSLFIAFSFALPIGIIQAATNQQIGLNVITEMIIGYVCPGKPVAMMVFKTTGYISMGQALIFSSDQKLAHYAKIPPKCTFFAQIGATIVAALVQILVQTWMFSHVPNMCQKGVAANFWCPSTQVFGTASVLWGVIGPSRTFSGDSIYVSLMHFFWIGALAPIPFYFLARRYPSSFFKYVNMPVLFSATGLLPPALPINVIAFIVVCFISNYLIRRRYFGWWSKHNYISAGGLIVGYNCALIFIFFTLQFPKAGSIGRESIQAWWGNNVFANVGDAHGLRWKTLGEGEFFGRASGW